MASLAKRVVATTRGFVAEGVWLARAGIRARRMVADCDYTFKG